MIRWTIAATVMVLAPLPAMAQTKAPEPDRIIDIAQPEVVAQALQEAGYKAVLKTPAGEQPYIQSAANGDSFTIQFYGCTNGKDCASLDFYAWYKKTPTFTPEFANRWNANNRFITLSIDKDGDLGLNQYLSTVGKITYANFADEVDWWSQMNGEVDKFIDAEDSKTAPAPGAKKL